VVGRQVGESWAAWHNELSLPNSLYSSQGTALCNHRRRVHKPRLVQPAEASMLLACHPHLSLLLPLNDLPTRRCPALPSASQIWQDPTFESKASKLLKDIQSGGWAEGWAMGA